MNVSSHHTDVSQKDVNELSDSCRLFLSNTYQIFLKKAASFLLAVFFFFFCMCKNIISVQHNLVQIIDWSL